MKGVYSAVFLTVCTHVVLVTGIEYCFHLTWPCAVIQKLNCTAHNIINPFTPCMEPCVPGDTKPNLTKIWYDDETERNNYTKPLEKGSVCVTYTYMYNGEVANVSYFGGKVTADRTTPVTEGCYVQYAEGYIIEVCVCKPKDDNSTTKPCNSTIRNTNSPLIILVAAAVSLFMYKIFEILLTYSIPLI